MKSRLILCGFIILSLMSCNKKSKAPQVAKKSDRVVWGIWGEIPQMNPFYMLDVKVWDLQSLVWEPLIFVDSKGQWQKHLALSWEFNKDLSEVKLKIQPDLQWSHGELVAEKDFIFSFNFYKNPNLKAAQWESVFADVQSVKYQAPYLVLRLGRPGSFGVWNKILSMARLLPASAGQDADQLAGAVEDMTSASLDSSTNPQAFKGDEASKSLTRKDLSKKSLEFTPGTGPLKVKDFSSTKPWLLEKNKNSWWYKKHSQNSGLDVPYVQIQKFLSESVLKSWLRKQGLDAFIDYGSQSVSAEKYFPLAFETLSKVLIFQLKSPHLNTWQKRECLYKSLPSEAEILKLEPQASFDQRHRLQQSFLPSKSTQACHASKPGTLKVIYESTQDLRWLNIWQEKAKQEGIHLDLTRQSRKQINQRLKDKSFEVIINENALDATGLLGYEIYHSKGQFNSQDVSSPELDALLAKKSKTFDFNIRQELSAEILNHIYEQLIFVPLYDYRKPMARSVSPCQENLNKNLWWSLYLCQKGRSF